MTKTTKIERSLLISKDLLTPNPWNPNKTNARQQKAIAESLATYNQVIDIIVRPDPNLENRYQIIDGEHRYNELSKEVYVTVLHGLTDAHAKKLTIILNETRGNADKIELAQLLSDISAEIDDPTELLDALPYEQNELDELVKLAEVDWDNFGNDDNPDFKGGDPTENEFIKLYIVIPKEALLVAEQAYELISQERELNKKKEVAWGQVLESLAADYISGASYS